MKSTNWLVVSRYGIKAVRKSKPALSYNEIAVRLELKIPDEMFVRPSLQATLSVSDVPSTSLDVGELVVNTKDLIEQQTGAKIEFTVVPEEKKT